MAKEIERRIDIPHGMSVSVGIMIMTLLQNREVNGILDAIKKMNIFFRISPFFSLHYPKCMLS